MFSIDKNGLKEDFMPTIRKGITDLELAKSKLNSIVMPADFSSLLKLDIFNIKRDVSNDCIEIKDIADWVEGRIYDFEALERKNMDLIASLILTDDPNLNIHDIRMGDYEVSSIAQDDFNSSCELSDYILNNEFDSNIIEKIEENGYYSELDFLYQYDYESNGVYGCDQGEIQDLIVFETPNGELLRYNSRAYHEAVEEGISLKRKVTSEEYVETESAIMAKYNMSGKDAAVILGAIDTIGACTYASVVNDIILLYLDKPLEFKEAFGYPLYEVDDNGKIKFNDKILLADLYILTNLRDRDAIYREPSHSFSAIEKRTIPIIHK